MHPNCTKLLEHAAWLRAKGIQHPQSKELLELIAQGMEIMSKESLYSIENQEDEIRIQTALVQIQETLIKSGDCPPATSRLLANMCEDVMLPLPSRILHGA